MSPPVCTTTERRVFFGNPTVTINQGMMFKTEVTDNVNSKVQENKIKVMSNGMWLVS